MEAADAGVGLILCVTEGIPVLDMAWVTAALKGSETRLIGPNGGCLITPDVERPGCKIGIMPGYIHKPGRVGVVSRSGTLTYEAVWQLTHRGLGQSTVVGIGGDPIEGSSFVDILQLFEEPSWNRCGFDDRRTGRFGGRRSGLVFHEKNVKTSPRVHRRTNLGLPGKRMGHAGAIVGGGTGGPSSHGWPLKVGGCARIRWSEADRFSRRPGRIGFESASRSLTGWGLPPFLLDRACAMIPSCPARAGIGSNRTGGAVTPWARWRPVPPAVTMGF